SVRQAQPRNARATEAAAGAGWVPSRRRLERRGRKLEGLRDRAEAELAQQPLELRLGARERPVVPDAGGEIHLEARLIRVDLPWMDVEGPRHTPPLRVAQRSPGQAVGEQPEIAAPSRGEKLSPDPQGRGGELGQLTAGAPQPVRVPLAAGEAVAFPLHREEAGVVAVALLDQDVQRPLAPRDDGIARRPVTQHVDSCYVLQDGLRAADAGAELEGRDRDHAVVAPAVRGDLMPGLGDLPHQVGIALGYPAEDEEGAGRLVLREQLQDPAGAPVDPARKGGPLIPGDV